MLDKDGYRLNVGIILVNSQGQVFLAKRTGQDAWQFPQGGMNPDETPEQALFRELHEEVGLLKSHVDILAVSAGWLKYELPEKYLRQPSPGNFIGQKQKWFFLRSKDPDIDRVIDLNVFQPSEFDDWRWVTYWEPLKKVIAFKRQVYQDALTEFEPIYQSLIV